MKKNAFTLVELIVAISIMSIVLVLAIPSIGAISERNARKRYENYGETLVSSGKLYTDSNAIDMFGYESDGCYDIYFDALEEKKLAKDIDYKDITCADGTTKKTYVKVRKLDGEIKYQLSMVCRDEKGEVVYDDLIDSSDILCDGRAPHTGPEITVSPEKQEAYLSEDETYKVSIKIHDDDGLLENNEVEYSWCRDASCTNVISTTKLRYENKRDADIKTVNKKIPRPKGDGEYYLKVRSVKVVDIFNNATTYEKIFGPYRFDITPPVVQVKAYKRSGSTKTGGEVGSATFNPKKLMSDKKYSVTGTISSKYTNNYSGWLNGTNYPDGIYYEITYSDNIQVRDEKWEYNKPNQKTKNTTSEKLDGGNSTNTLNKISGVIDEYLLEDGYRKGRITVKDLAGNYVETNLEAYIDKTPPTAPSITNPTNGNWVNYSFSITLKSTDAMSGIKKYQYSYNSTNKAWVDYDNSDSVVFETTDFSQERSEAAFVRSMDVAGNYSAENSTGIKIDKTKPDCSNSGGNDAWINTSRTLVGTCSDPRGSATTSVASGCVNKTVKDRSYNNGNVSWLINWEGNWTNLSPGTVYDAAGNSTVCPSNQTVRIDKTAPDCTSSGGSSTWINTSRTLVGTCKDKGTYQSGCTNKTVANRTYSNGNVSWLINWEGNYENLSPGTVYDEAGNSTPCPSNQTVKIDQTAPKCSIKKTVTGDTAGVDYTVSCSDSASGMKSGEAKCAGSSHKTSSNKYNLTETTDHYAYDAVGNKSVACTVTVTAQNQKKTCTTCKTCNTSTCLARSECHERRVCPTWFGGQLANASCIATYQNKAACTNVGGSFSGSNANSPGQCTIAAETEKYSASDCSCTSWKQQTDCSACKGCSVWSDKWVNDSTCTSNTYSKQCQTVYN